jgi:hypothetical protein
MAHSDILRCQELDSFRGMAWAVDSKSVWVGAYIDRSARGTHSGVFNVALTGNVNVAFKGTLTTLLPVPSPDGRRLALWALTRSSICGCWKTSNRFYGRQGSQICAAFFSV